MALQTQNLVMVGLSVRNDRPPNAIQPRQVDGIHLRWTFERQLGFPWYGYYLFRRRHDPADIAKRKVNVSNPTLQPGSTTLDSAEGQLTSDSTLVLTNFPPTNAVGLDLDRRSYLRFIPSELANRVEVRIGLQQDIPANAPITITALLQGSNPLQRAPVARVHVSGHAGDVIERTLEADAISAIEFSEGPAVLLELGYVSIAGGQMAGWQEVPDFPYPMCLPVMHPDYPCNPGPVNRSAAERMALRRVLYGPPGDWAGVNFLDLHGQLLTLVDGGPGTTPMAERVTSLPSPPPQPAMPKQYPLDLVLLGALHPAIAQMVGLYWVDRRVDPNEIYDYLIVAAHQVTLGSTATDALQWLGLNGFDAVDAFIVFNKSLKESAPPLEAPSGLKTYALPSASLRPQISSPPQPENNAGLRWDLGVTDLGGLLPGKAVMYHLWRAGLGNGENPTAPGSYNLITKSGPVLVVEPAKPTGKLLQRPPDWPPDRLHYLDSSLVDGWYSYQVSGVDIFGRHSGNSAAGPWYQWTPAPKPPPWYWDPPTAPVVHPFAVRLLDTLSPPPPTGIEAYALDPADPTVLKDAAYNTWWNSLTASAWYQALTEEAKKNLIGLRVRWLWTHTHMRQAPDTREFRIYYHPDLMNVLLGTIRSVTATSATESDVATSINPPTPPSLNAYQGRWLQVGNDAFNIVSSQAGNPLRLKVSNIGPQDDLQPQPNMPCALAIPDGHPSFVDYSVATNWQERYYVVNYNAHVTQTLLPALDPGGNKLGGAAAVVSGTTVSLDGAPDLSAIRPSGEQLFLAGDTNRPDKAYPITAVDNLAKTVTVDGTPNVGGTPSAWTIVFPLRTYEVFLPAAGDTVQAGLPLHTSLAEPITYAHVSVSAADDKTYISDKRTTGRWGNRSGNEGRVGAPAKIFRVRREPPPAPTLPPTDSDKVYTTPADYHNHSFYTFRWVPIANVKTHIFRALDESIFMIDWLIRATRGSLDPVNPQHETIFPAAWSLSQKQAAASQLNAITSIASYAALSSDAQKILARLPGNEDATGVSDLQQRDWKIRTSRKSLTDNSMEYFPDEWKPVPDTVQMQQKRQNVAAELNAIASATVYQTLSNDALRVLAGLPGNALAFTQLTIQPLDVNDPANFDRRGPDNADNYTPNTGWRAYMDTLDGRSTNCYFYRAGAVDGAHNRSKDFSLSSPPVYCPDIVPPRAPVITKVFAGDPDASAPGDRKITLRWVSNRELDLKEYRVYRADNREAARDLRLMTQVAIVAAMQPTPAEVTWTDTPVPSLVTFYYRLVVVDDAGNVSEPSLVVAGRAFDDALPVVPTPSIQWVASPPLVARVTWTATAETLLERRPAAGGGWSRVTGWLPPGNHAIDDLIASTVAWLYRLRARKATGAMAAGQEVALKPL